jgi:hypothetical protein
MSSQPVSINRQQQTEELKAKRQRAERRSDALYVAGAVLMSAGLGWIRIYLALIALGIFCLVFPALELITGFIRGLRSPGGRR